MDTYLALMDPRYDYCGVFVRGPITREDVLSLVVSSLNARPAPFYSAETPHVTVDVRNNDDFDESKSERFGFWPIHLDITRNKDAPDNAVREAVATLLTSLWQRAMGAVASCKFENELPRAGGHQQ
jgi:hypothetical protein